MYDQDGAQPDVISSVCTDTFVDTRPSGKVIGSISPSGIVRKGVDAEKVIAIDHGALRIQPLMKPGWGRAGIAYGPYQRRNGLAFAVFCTNGHNTSQTGPIEGMKHRLARWLRGSEIDSVPRRLLRWSRNGHKKILGQQLMRWLRSSPRAYRYLHPYDINENLALGWFPNEVPANPLAEGHAFVVHATGSENGELWARVGSVLLPVIRGLQNLQIYYVVVLREQGAAYYVASAPQAHGMAAYPSMRPVAIDPFHANTPLYAGVYQSVLGQIGFRVDTRIYAAQVAYISNLDTWYGTAHAADALNGQGALHGSTADVGGMWIGHDGGFERTEHGVQPVAQQNVAWLDPGVSSGLIHIRIETAASDASDVQMLWRVQDQDNYWSVQLNHQGCRLGITTDGEWIEVASSEHALAPNSVYALQILDDGQMFSICLNGAILFHPWLTDTRFQHATGIGFHTTNASHDLRLRFLEAHPRSVPIPTALDLGSPWMPTSSQIVVADDFDGLATELAGRITPTGDKIWQRDIGNGSITLTGQASARVCADVHNPNPGRTAYGFAWDYPDFADLQVTIRPPGSDRGQQENGRGGLFFWQDADNYIIINTWLDDLYEGASISSFFYLNGFEDIYDAVWTNVGKRVYWGNSYTLRVVFDGLNFTAFVNNEPVLYRCLTDVYPNTTRLAINRVGIAANWEWGNDTGSEFKHFAAKM